MSVSSMTHPHFLNLSVLSLLDPAASKTQKMYEKINNLIINAISSCNVSIVPNFFIRYPKVLHLEILFDFVRQIDVYVESVFS